MRNEREKKGNEGKDERERGKEEKEREMIYGGAYSKVHYGICTVICILNMGPLPSLLTSCVTERVCEVENQVCMTRKPLFFHLVSHLLLEK